MGLKVEGLQDSQSQIPIRILAIFHVKTLIIH